MSDLWTEASHSTEAAEFDEKLAMARVETVEFWPFISEARSPMEYENRKALAEERIEAVIESVTDKPSLQEKVRTALYKAMDDDFLQVHTERQAEAKKEAEVRARVEANNRKRRKAEKELARVEKEAVEKKALGTYPSPDIVTDGACGLSWDDSIPTSMTPAPSARCPFEYFHEYDEDMEPLELEPEDIPDDWPVQPIGKNREASRKEADEAMLTDVLDANALYAIRNEGGVVVYTYVYGVEAQEILDANPGWTAQPQWGAMSVKKQSDITLSRPGASAGWVDEGDWSNYEAEGIGEGDVHLSDDAYDTGTTDQWVWEAFTYDDLDAGRLRGSGVESDKETAKQKVERWVADHSDIGISPQLFSRKKQGEFNAWDFALEEGEWEGWTEAYNAGYAAYGSGQRAYPFQGPDAPVGSEESKAWMNRAKAYQTGYEQAADDAAAQVISKKTETQKTSGIELSNVAIEDKDEGIVVGTDSGGNKVRFRATSEEIEQLQHILLSDLAINFSSVEVEEEDVISTTGPGFEGSKQAVEYGEQYDEDEEDDEDEESIAPHSKRYEAAKKVVESRLSEKLSDGTLLDPVTAKDIVQVYDRLSPKNQAKFDDVPLNRLASFVTKVVSKYRQVSKRKEARGPDEVPERSLHQVDAASLQPGDRFLKPSLGSAFYVTGDGRVMGAGHGPGTGTIDGHLFEVTSVQDGVLGARRLSDGKTIAEMIPPGATQLLVVGQRKGSQRKKGVQYLVVSRDTDSVVVQGNDLEEAVLEAYELGYSDGYVWDQEGGYGELGLLIDIALKNRGVDDSLGLGIGMGQRGKHRGDGGGGA